jgi:hypothetical protein
MFGESEFFNAHELALLVAQELQKSPPGDEKAAGPLARMSAEPLKSSLVTAEFRHRDFINTSAVFDAGDDGWTSAGVMFGSKIHYRKDAGGVLSCKCVGVLEKGVGLAECMAVWKEIDLYKVRGGGSDVS